jgi:long-chain acyl-CoA synthetase
VRELIQEEVEALNARMPPVQHVRKFHLLVKELDHDDGEVTASMKVKRGSIVEKYGAAIEAMYGERTSA